MAIKPNMTKEETEELYNDISKMDSRLDSIENKLLAILALAISMFSAYIIVVVIWDIPNQWPEISMLVMLLIAIACLLKGINLNVKELAYQ